jgi:hypothetical protein
MTSIGHTGRNATFLPIALAAAVLLAIVATAVVAVALPSFPGTEQAPVTRFVDTSAAVASGRAWQAQREQQSVDGIRVLRARAYLASDAMTQAGRAWQAQREQQSLDGIRHQRQTQQAADWQRRYEQMHPIR